MLPDHLLFFLLETRLFIEGDVAVSTVKNDLVAALAVSICDEGFNEPVDIVVVSDEQQITQQGCYTFDPAFALDTPCQQLHLLYGLSAIASFCFALPQTAHGCPASMPQTMSTMCRYLATSTYEFVLQEHCSASSQLIVLLVCTRLRNITAWAEAHTPFWNAWNRAYADFAHCLPSNTAM